MHKPGRYKDAPTTPQAAPSSGYSPDGRLCVAWKKNLASYLPVDRIYSIGSIGSTKYTTRKENRRELVENSDFRKFDETLRMALDLTAKQTASFPWSKSFYNDF
jgi:hypothetical protein